MPEPDRTALLAEAKALLTANGYVVLTEKSYRAAQERQRIAKVRQECAERDKQSQWEWLERDVFPQERHWINRVEHLGAVATRLGATSDDLWGPCDCRKPDCLGKQRPLTPLCFCGQPDDRERVHRAHACEPWVAQATPEPAKQAGARSSQDPAQASTHDPAQPMTTQLPHTHEPPQPAATTTPQEAHS